MLQHSPYRYLSRFYTMLAALLYVFLFLFHIFYPFFSLTLYLFHSTPSYRPFSLSLLFFYFHARSFFVVLWSLTSTRSLLWKATFLLLSSFALLRALPLRPSTTSRVYITYLLAVVQFLCEPYANTRHPRMRCAYRKSYDCVTCFPV